MYIVVAGLLLLTVLSKHPAHITCENPDGRTDIYASISIIDRVYYPQDLPQPIAVVDRYGNQTMMDVDNTGYGVPLERCNYDVAWFSNLDSLKLDSAVGLRVEK